MQVKQEIQTQLEWFIDKVGSLPTHIDGHQHIHVIQYLPAYKNLFFQI